MSFLSLAMWPELMMDPRAEPEEERNLLAHLGHTVGGQKMQKMQGVCKDPGLGATS